MTIGPPERRRGAVALAALLVFALAAGLMVSVRPLPSPSPTGGQATGSTAGSATPSTALGSPTPPPNLSPPSPTPAPTPHSAPTSPAGFLARRTLVPLVFPLPETASYNYLDDWLVPRVGRAYGYNHVRNLDPGGPVVRAHDGIDIHVASGTPVVAPFGGTVIEPATRWRPWPLDRYGISVVIVSDEPTSLGYAVILAHLSRASVTPGDQVVSGQQVGLTGRTGNAEKVGPELHIELRAPFLIAFREAGMIRRLDAFDPYYSLLVADLHRRPLVPPYRWQEV